MQHLDAGGLHEQLAGEMLGGAEACAAENVFAGIRFRERDQFLYILGGKVGLVTISRLAVATSEIGSNAVSVS